jgi:two-component system, response regulator AauR
MASTVLIVEDNANIRLAMSTFLKLKGYEVREAGNCEEARGQMAKGGIAVTITDLDLPDGKGDELVGQASHPVIAMTGHVDDGTKARIQEQGFAAFLPKPASFDQVISAIEAATIKV